MFNSFLSKFKVLFGGDNKLVTDIPITNRVVFTPKKLSAAKPGSAGEVKEVIKERTGNNKKPTIKNTTGSSKVIYKIDLTENELPNFHRINIENEEPQKLCKLV